MKVEQINQMLNWFCGNEDHRPMFHKPFEQSGKIIATDAYAVIRVNPAILDEVDVQQQPNGDFHYPDVSQIFIAPNCKYIINRDDLKRALADAGIDSGERWMECQECGNTGYVTWRYDSDSGETYTKLFDCPICDGEGLLENGVDKLIAIRKKKFRGYHVLQLYKAAELADEKYILLIGIDGGKYLFHIGPHIEVMLMANTIRDVAVNATVKVKKQTEHAPSECFHCNADGIHCDKHTEPAGENVWVYPCHLQEFPCTDYEPKNKKDNEDT